MIISIWKWLALYAVVLAIVLFLFGAKLDLNVLPISLLAVNAVLALVAAGIVTLVLVVLAIALAWVAKKVWRKVLARVTLFTLLRAVDRYSAPVQAVSIGERNGSLVIRLPLGEDSGMVSGQRFSAINLATGGLLGVIESFDVEKLSCSCSLSGSINIEFWEELEARMRREFSPPAGVIFSREIPEGFWDLANGIIRHWGG